MRDNGAACPRLPVAATEAQALTIVPGDLGQGVLIVCDHAGNAFPEGYGNLGLAAGDLNRHIAYDIGAAAVARTLAAELDAPAVLTRFSRLLIDCNRGTDDPTLIMRLADGSPIPGNRRLTDEERSIRIESFYNPYHETIDGLIARALKHGVAPIILSVHSFTPIWKGTPRPWHVGVLWDKDPRLAGVLLAQLAAEPSLVVGDNEPYNGCLLGDCMWKHGTQRGLAHALIEVRQDLIGDEPGQDAWAARLARMTKDILASDGGKNDLRTQRYFGSNAT